MKAKELLKSLVRCGMVDGSIHTGKSILDARFKVHEGKVMSNKEYFYSFNKISLMIHNAIIETSDGTIVYLYSI